MTPPDSGDYLRARTIRNMENPMKPNSGEREVLTEDELAELHKLDKGGEATALEWRASVLAAHPFLLAEVEHHRAHCPSKDLAHRILAALERAAAYEPTLRDDYAEIASELRAAVERTP